MSSPAKVIGNRTEVYTEWAKHFATLNADVINSHGLGLQANSQIKEGETIAHIPASLTLSNQTINDMAMEDEKLARWLALQNVSDRHRLHRAILYFALMNTPRKWIVYFKLLPANGDINLPFSWNEEDLEFLKGTSIFESTRIKRTVVDSQYKGFVKLAQPLLDGKELPFSLWVLAYQWISSRSLTEPKTGLSAVVPIIDLCNHADDANVRYDVDGDNYVLLATRNISPGEELTLDYGSRSSAEFLFNYGFIPDTWLSTSRLVRIYDPKDQTVRRILDPSQHPDCPDEDRKNLEASYELLLMFLARPSQVLVLNENGTWEDEFVTLLACEDEVSLKMVDDQYSLYYKGKELVPGEIQEQVKDNKEIMERGDELVAELAEYLITQLPENNPLPANAAGATGTEDHMLGDVAGSGAAAHNLLPAKDGGSLSFKAKQSAAILAMHEADLYSKFELDNSLRSG